MVAFNRFFPRFVPAALTGLALTGAATADEWARPFVSFGIGSSDSQVDWTAGGPAIFAPSGYVGSGNATSTTVSAQVGQMYRQRDFLLGWAVDLTDLNHSESVPSPLFPGDTFATRIGPMLSVAGRVGKDYGKWMVYGEAGVGLAKIGVPNETPFCAGGPCRLSLESTTTGLVAGIGADYRVSDRYSIGVNYRHVNFQDKTVSGTVSGLGAPQEYQVGGDADVFSVRLTIALD